MSGRTKAEWRSLYEALAHKHNVLLGDASRNDNTIERLNNTIVSEQRLSHERLMEARKHFAELAVLRQQIHTMLAALGVAAQQLLDEKQKPR